LIDRNRHTESAKAFPDLTGVTELGKNTVGPEEPVRGLVKFEGDGSNPGSRSQGLFEKRPNRLGHRARMCVGVESQQLVAAGNVQLNDSGQIQIAEE
jgi:hypothetical protein